MESMHLWLFASVKRLNKFAQFCRFVLNMSCNFMFNNFSNMMPPGKKTTRFSFIEKQKAAFVVLYVFWLQSTCNEKSTAQTSVWFKRCVRCDRCSASCITHSTVTVQWCFEPASFRHALLQIRFLTMLWVAIPTFSPVGNFHVSF